MAHPKVDPTAPRNPTTPGDSYMWDATHSKHSRDRSFLCRSYDQIRNVPRDLPAVKNSAGAIAMQLAEVQIFER